jgi:hypothetical protein
MTGRAAINSNSAGEERQVRFIPDEVVEIEDVLPQHLRLVEYSPFNPVT